MDAEKIYTRLGIIESRLTTIETDISWFKMLTKWLVVGVLTLVGIEAMPFLME